MPGRRDAAVVYIVEEEEWADDLSADRWLLGTFRGHLETGRRIAEEFAGLDTDDAIAWGRARSERVFIRLGDGPEHYAAGTDNPFGEPVWPPAELPRLGRRRPPSERWKDRSHTDPPIEWVVPLDVTPPRLPASEEDIYRARCTAAEAAGAKPPKRLGGGYHVLEGIPFRVSAHTREEAVAIATAQCPVPEGWTANAMLHAVRPA